MKTNQTADGLLGARSIGKDVSMDEIMTRPRVAERVAKVARLLKRAGVVARFDFAPTSDWAYLVVVDGTAEDAAARLIKAGKALARASRPAVGPRLELLDFPI